MTPMKSEAELKRAIHLLCLMLSGQVKLKRPLPPDAILNLQGAARALQWTLNFPDSVPLEKLLRDIDHATIEPGFNPHHVTSE